MHCILMWKTRRAEQTIRWASNFVVKAPKNSSSLFAIVSNRIWWSPHHSLQFNDSSGILTRNPTTPSFRFPKHAQGIITHYTFYLQKINESTSNFAQDIRSFFSVVSVKKSTEPALLPSPPAPTNRKKRKALVISDDEDDAIVASDRQKSTKSSPAAAASKRPTTIGATKKSTKPDLKKLRRVDVADMFGTEPAVKPTNETIAAAELDVSILDDLNESIFEEEAAAAASATKNESPTKRRQRSQSRTPQKMESDRRHRSQSRTPQKIGPPPCKLNDDFKIPKKEETDDNAINGTIEMKTPTKKKDAPPTTPVPSSSSSSSSNRRKRTATKAAHDDPDVVETDEDRQEKRRHVAILYQQYKNRSGPAHPGSKEIPKVHYIIFLAH